MVIKKLFCLIILLLLILNLYSQESQSVLENLTTKEKQFISTHPRVTLAGGVSFEPFLIQNSDGSIGGYDVDIANIISERTGLDIQFELGPWNIMQERAKKREFYGLSTTSKDDNPERAKYYNQSNGYFITQPVIIVKKDNPDNLKTNEDLLGKRASMQEGNTYFIDIIKDMNDNAEIIYTADIYDMIQKVVNGDSDYTVLDETAFYIASMIGLGGLIEAAFSVQQPYEICFSLSNEFPELVSIFNKGLDSISETEQFTLRKKWFSFSEISQIDSKNKLNLTAQELSFLSQTKTIKIAMVSNQAPFETVSDEDFQEGIVADYMELISEKIGVEIQFILTSSFDEEINALKNGKCEIISLTSDDLYFNEELNVTENYLSFDYVFVTTNEKLFIDNLEIISDEKIAVIKNSKISNLLKKKGMTLVEVDTTSEGFSALRKNEVYTFIDSSASITYYMYRETKQDLKISGILEVPPFLLKFATNKKNDILYTIIQKTISTISEKEKNQIINKWGTIVYTNSVNFDIIFRVLLLIVLILSITLYFNRKLRMSNKKTGKALNDLLLLQQQLEIKNKSLKSYTEKLSTSEKRYRELNTFKDKTIQVITHDLKVPILYFRQLIDKGIKDDNSFSSEKRIEFYYEIKEAIESIDLLMDNLFSMGIKYKNTNICQKEILSLNNLYNSALAYNSQSIRNKRISIQSKFEDDILIHADPLMIISVFRNILSNAVKFTQRKGKVIISHSISPDKVIVYISDNGVGISEERVNFITENLSGNFSSIGTIGEKGTGLGLSLCFYFLQLHNSKLSISSDAKGTKVSFALDRYIIP